MTGAPVVDQAPLFIVFNAGSGSGDAQETRGAIEAACRAAGRTLELLVVDGPDRIGGLAAEAVRGARAAGGIVVAAGGDGTINAVAQAALGSGCAFGVLPRGTFNYFSRVHGISSEPDVALRQLLSEQARPVQVGLVNDRVFLVNASLGLYPKLLEDREAYKKQYGRSRVVAFGAALATLMGAHRGWHLEVDADGEHRKLHTTTLFVGNNALQMQQIGVAEGEAIDRGELAAIALRPVSRLVMAWLLLRGAVGRLGEAERVLSFPVQTLNVASARGPRRVKVATDGEVVWMRLPLQFRVAPEPLWLIKPPESAGLAETA